MLRNRSTKTDASEALLTVKDVAERDRCSEKTVRRAIKAGLLEAIRIGPGGRLLRIRAAAHEAYRGDRRGRRCPLSQRLNMVSGISPL